MQKNIHPKSTVSNMKCSCGNVIETVSTLCKDITLDVCSACHPFYTGQQKSMADRGGRISRFKGRYGILAVK